MAGLSYGKRLPGGPLFGKGTKPPPNSLLPREKSGGRATTRHPTSPIKPHTLTPSAHPVPSFPSPDARPATGALREPLESVGRGVLCRRRQHNVQRSVECWALRFEHCGNGRDSAQKHRWRNSCERARDRLVLGGVFAQRAHSANYYGDYPGNNPENHPPAESCTINSKLKNSNI